MGDLLALGNLAGTPKATVKMDILLPFLIMSGCCHMVIMNSHLFLKNILRGVVKIHRAEKHWQMRVWLLAADSPAWPQTGRWPYTYVPAGERGHGRAR